jgi:hypothetical protein
MSRRAGLTTVENKPYSVTYFKPQKRNTSKHTSITDLYSNLEKVQLAVDLCKRMCYTYYIMDRKTKKRILI